MMFTPVQVALSGAPSEAGLIKHVGNKSFISIYNSVLTAALVAGQPYVITFTKTAGKEVDVKAPFTLITAANIVVVPQEAIANAAYGWVQVYGEAEVLIDGVITAGHYIEVLNAGTTFITEGNATGTVASVGVAVDAKTLTASALHSVFLFGKQVGVLAT
jgi:hypothetical protein